MQFIKISGPFYSYILAATGLVLLFTGGHFTYGLDDTYIHLALAKHLVQNGVWGVTPYAPSACSSSIIWPLLLSGCIYLFGLNLMIPFYLSLVIVTGFALWLNYEISKEMEDEPQRTAFTWLILFASCIGTLVFIGMEHVLQVWMCTWFAWHGAKVLAAPQPTFKHAWPLFILGPLMTSARYEALGLVAAVCVMLTFRNGIRHMFGRGFVIGCVVCLAALTPVVAFGLAMHRLDLPFLPYSVQLKAWAPHVAFHGLWLHLGPKFLINSLAHPELFFLLWACLYTLRNTLRSGVNFWTVPSVLQVIYVVSSLLHLEFAATGPYSRYVAYLIAMGVLALGLHAGPLFRVGLQPVPKSENPGRLRRFISVGTCVTLVLMAIVSHLVVPQKARNIYQQQVQMARFLGTYYDGQAVALNDIGTSSFLTNIRMVDVFGLASKEVADIRLHGDYGADDIERIATEQAVQLAIVYPNWFQTAEGSILPADWEYVGEWKIPYNIICGSDTVAIFSVNPAARDQLVENLKAFSSQMPQAVIQSGPYTESKQ